MDSISAGTCGAAQLLEMDREIGSVTVGRLADLVVVMGNPLDDVSLLETGAMCSLRVRSDGSVR